MPRPGPRRPYIGVRLDPEQLARVETLAATATDGNVSEMVRKLLTEALDARSGRLTSPEMPTGDKFIEAFYNPALVDTPSRKRKRKKT